MIWRARWRSVGGLFLRIGFVLEELVEIDVIFTDHFREVPGGSQLERDLATPGLGVRFWVLNSQVVLQRLVVHSPDALHQMQIGAVRMARAIQPRFVVEPDGVDN